MRSPDPHYRYRWTRFWCPSTGTYSLDSGYLLNPMASYSRYVRRDVVPFSSIADVPCLALLGEAGSGKSTSLADERSRVRAGAGSARVIDVDLKAYGDMGRLERALFEGEAYRCWLDGDDLLHVFLDTLDECTIQEPFAASVLLEHLRRLSPEQRARLRLRIACRTTAWPTQFDAQFPELWGKDGFGRYELLPLREVDVADAARTEGLDSRRFLAEVARLEAQPLASRPITLRLLLLAFQRHQALPATRAEAFLQGTRLLAEEPSDSRRDARVAGTLRAEERVAVAARIAALLVLCRRSLVVPAALAVDGPSIESLERAAIEGGAEPVGHQRVTVDREAVEEVLASGLFTDLGQGRGFAHQSFGEFLAAHHLLANRVPAATLHHLVVDERGRAIPQLLELAGWLAEMEPEVRGCLLQSDPQALLRSDLGAAGAGEKAALVESLLDGFARGELGDVDGQLHREYRKLQHPGLGAQLIPYIRDRTLDGEARRFAIDVGRACEVHQLQDLLASIALDRGESAAIRQAAARALVRVADALATKRRLLPLVAGGDDDPDEQLKGHALATLWPGTLRVEELLPWLTSPRRPMFLGSYRVFLRYNAVQAMTVEDLPPALAWAGTQVIAHDRYDLGEMIDELWLCGTRHLDNDTIRSSLADALMAAALVRQNLFHDLQKRDEWRRLVQGSSFRRPLCERMMEAITDRARQATELLWLRILVPEDFFWVLARVRAAGVQPAAESWAHILLALFERENPRHVDAVLSAADNPAVARVFAELLGAVALASDQAARQRRSYELSQPPEAAKPRQEQLPLDRIGALLDKIERGYLASWQELAARLAAYELETDLAKQPPWAALDERLRQRVLGAAKRLLGRRGRSSPAWTTVVTPSREGATGSFTVRRAALGAYRALVLLMRSEPAWLREQDVEFWRRWSTLVVRSWLFSMEDDEPHLRLAGMAFAKAPGAAITALRHEIDSEGQGDRLSVLERLRYAWGVEGVGRALFTKARRGRLRPVVLRQLLRALVEHEVPGAAEHAMRLVTLPPPQEREARMIAVAAAAILLGRPQPAGWDRAWRAIGADTAFGREVIGQVASSSHDHGITRLGKQWQEGRIADLYLWIEREFPLAEDPAFGGLVTERHAIADLRRQLGELLKLRGTAAACAALRRIEAALPAHPWLRLVRLEAERQAQQADWVPLEPGDVLQLGRRPETQVVQTADQLRDAILASLGRLEQHLQGSPPMSQRLWNELEGKRWRPKDEGALADEIVVHLRADLRPEGFVALREVEFSRGITGIQGRRRGKKTDILVIGKVRDAVSGAERQLQVILEVKGSWHPDLRLRLRTQLVERYLDRTGCRHGIYVVGWYQCELWDRKDRRSRPYRRTRCEELARVLEEAAGEIADGRSVRAMVLDARLKAS